MKIKHFACPTCTVEISLYALVFNEGVAYLAGMCPKCKSTVGMDIQGIVDEALAIASGEAEEDPKDRPN